MFWRTQTKLKGLTPAIGASPNFVLPQKVLSDSNNNLYSATLSPTESKLYSLWENHYKAIGVTNLVLDALPEASISESEKESYGAEMNFFRAYFYFDLVQQFGKIPLVTEAIQEPQTDFKRSSVADVYKLIVSDLRYAAEHLR